MHVFDVLDVYSYTILFYFVNKGLNRGSEVEDINGKRMSAMTLFSMAINYMRGHLMTALKKQVPEIEQSDVMFVITVPAIWNDGSKQFMREAAIAVSGFICIFELFTIIMIFEIDEL